MSKHSLRLCLGILIQLCLIPRSIAVIQTLGIDVICADGSCDETLFASQSNFGTFPAMTAEKNEPMIPNSPPSDDPLLCEGKTALASEFLKFGADKKFVLVVPRGSCTFEQKTLNAQNLGASGVIIYGNLASRYSLNTTQIEAHNNQVTPNDVIYPREFDDYDCDKASAEIPVASLSFSEFPYDSVRNDPVLSGPASQGNLCAAQNDNFAEVCPSERCLLTGDLTLDQSMMKACCAWDLHIWLYKDDKLEVDINIPTMYITMAQADSLLNYMQTRQITVTMYQRYYPKYNVSSVLIWALGVFVAALAAWMSGSEYRDAKIVSHGEETQSISSGNGSYQSGSNAEEYERVGATQVAMREESLELSSEHACGFIVFSSAGLLTLFFLKIYNIVKVFYAIGCSSAIFQIIFYPFFYRIISMMGLRDRRAFTTDCLEIGDVSYVMMVAGVISYGLGGVWTYMALFVDHPDSITFFWVMQDIMGACMCILFLATMKLNSIKVASVLLTAAFFYDIFFVFVTPYLTKGGKSIMVDVATSGGPPTADPLWCEKYPGDENCQGGDPLPMLFTIPRIFDYQGGSSMLGLGDIVLPGLLLSFASRYDEAKRLIGCSSREGQASPQNCSRKSKGYFPYLVVAYAVGLAMANFAVYAMQMGQPALLYLVPCCLGTMTYLGWKRGELNELWDNPKVLAACDEMLYGPLPVERPTDDHSGEEVENPLRPIS